MLRPSDRLERVTGSIIDDYALGDHIGSGRPHGVMGDHIGSGRPHGVMGDHLGSGRPHRVAPTGRNVTRNL